MRGHNIDNPIYDMDDAVAELYKVADMAEVITEAIFNGDDVTLQIIGNSMDVFLSQLWERIVRVEMLNGIMASRFSWTYDVQGGDTDRYCEREFEEYASRREGAGQEPEPSRPYNDALAFVRQMPVEQRGKLCSLLKEAVAMSRKQGFIEGHKAAVSRCTGNGGADNGGA